MIFVLQINKDRCFYYSEEEIAVTMLICSWYCVRKQNIPKRTETRAIFGVVGLISAFENVIGLFSEGHRDLLLTTFILKEIRLENNVVYIYFFYSES